MINRFKPSQPDRAMNGRPENMTPAKLGHLNVLVDQINKEIASLGSSTSEETEGSDVILTGYAIGTTPLADVSDSDSVNEAIAKLEKRIVDLETAAAV